MPALPLAVGIADTVIRGEQQHAAPDVEAAVDQLLETRPGADVSREDGVEALAEEMGQPAPA